MTRRKTPSTERDPELSDLDREEFGSRALNRKTVLDMLRKKESLEEADLRGLDLSGVSFDGARLVYAKFAEANLSKCSFRGANLTGASFFGASLKDAVLDESNLEEADFDYAWLDGVTLRGATIRKAIFPLKKVKLDDIRESVRSGRRLAMEPFPIDDDD